MDEYELADRDTHCAIMALLEELEETGNVCCPEYRELTNEAYRLRLDLGMDMDGLDLTVSQLERAKEYSLA